MAAVTTQQYCLRWNNHRSNLLAVFEELLQNEAFTDVTLVCEGGAPIKCHRMVLAACSPYFQNLFIDLPCKHPVVVLKDVRYGDIKAILEYMYRGEVNVAQDQLAGLLKVAEALKVKGLVENRSRSSPPPAIKQEESSPSAGDHSPNSYHQQHQVHSSSGGPPSPQPQQYKNPYNASYDRRASRDGTAASRLALPIWAVPGLPMHATAPQPPQHVALSGGYEGDMSPLKRKKLSSLLAQRERDTPILRTVLGQGQTAAAAADSSQPVSLVCHPDDGGGGSGEERERLTKMKSEPSEDAQSPYTDYSERTDDQEQPKHASPSPPQQQQFPGGGIAPYVPAHNREWKRYKQYTRDDIMSAIEAVRNGMSALQAARKYNVPSRTLYDKVKKLGITTSRPFKRGTNGSAACFPYASPRGGGSPYHLSETEEPPMMNNNSTTMLEASSFLQHALDRGAGAADGRDALAAMAAAAAARSLAAAAAAATAAAAGGPIVEPLRRSRSPSPGHPKYHHHHHQRAGAVGPRPSSLTPSPRDGSDSSERDDDAGGGVEDLSVGRDRRVIVPTPVAQLAAKREEQLLLLEAAEGARRELGAEAE